MKVRWKVSNVLKGRCKAEDDLIGKVNHIAWIG